MVRLYEKDSCLTGAIAPNFRLIDINNSPIELSKLKGRVVFLNFGQQNVDLVWMKYQS